MGGTKTIKAEDARRYWRALMENCASLLEDAELLLEHMSIGRAGSLQVLAMEELAKALWIYEVAEEPWSAGQPEVVLPEDFDKLAVRHLPKLTKALAFDSELESFWGDFPSTPLDITSLDDLVEHFGAMLADFQRSAKELDRRKQAGFYVDRSSDGTITTPASTIVDGVETGIRRTAEVALMLLIKDHSRMKFDAIGDYDSTHETQRRLIAVGHPEMLEDSTSG